LAAVTLTADDVDDYAKSALLSQHIPGLSLAVIRSGNLAKAEGYGMANLENGMAARPETVYKIGSVSKQFVASGVMLLVQDAKVALDDRINRYLPGTPESWSAITVRHVLTHTSGLARESPGFDPYKLQPDMDVIQAAFALPLRFQPGEKWDYSNLGYYVLAEIIRNVSGKPWSDFIAERIFIPLQMTNTRPTTVADVIPNRAGGYIWDGKQYRNAENWPAVRPSGAFLSTVLDMAKWELALQADRILTEDSKKQMWTPVVLNSGRMYAYGFGWELDDWPANAPQPTGVPMIRHEGSIPGFRAGFSRWPTQNLAVIILANRENAPMEGLQANVATRVAPELKTNPPAR
jgi:CubicO group peptidase (beta-lactamase class C family)